MQSGRGKHGVNSYKQEYNVTSSGMAVKTSSHYSLSPKNYFL